MFSKDSLSTILVSVVVASLVLTTLTSTLRHLKSKFLSHRQPPPSPTSPPPHPTVLSTSISHTHTFTKTPTDSLTLLPGLGIQGDSHLGTTVQHRSRLHIRPPPLNLRQVHLLQIEILTAHALKPGELGENITTAGIDLLALARGTRLRFVPAAAEEEDGDREGEEPPCIAITGLRNPCPQIEKFRAGLQEKFIERDREGKIVVRRAGVMSTVEVGGTVRPGMRIVVEPPEKFVALECV